MSRTVIQVEKIGKRYRIGQAKRQTALSHAIGDALRAPARLFRRGANPAPGANGSASTNGNKSIHIGKDSSGGSPYIWALNFARLRSVFGKAQPKVPSAFFQRRSVAKRELPSS